MVRAGDPQTRYRTISTLGAGGMATVLLAEDTVLGRHVALKRLLGTSTSLRGGVRLRREALVGASLRHPNLVTVYDVIESDTAGEVIVVMEYVAGETLARRLSRQERLPITEAVGILDGIGAALDAIHARGIVHRDVKPANILLGTDGAVKLADLGIVLLLDRTRITSQGAVVGSFRYMAPEQLGEGQVTSAVDVYALAAVAYEMLSGRKARSESNLIAMARAITTQPPPDLREAWPQAPEEVVRLLGSAMSRDPAARPRSAGELVKGLRGALLPAEPTPDPSARTTNRLAAIGATTRAWSTRRNFTGSPHRGSRRRSSRRAQAIALVALAVVTAAAAGLVLASPLSGAGTSRGGPDRPLALSSVKRSAARRSARARSTTTSATTAHSLTRHRAKRGGATTTHSATSQAPATNAGSATTQAPVTTNGSATSSTPATANGPGTLSHSTRAPPPPAPAAPAPVTSGTATPIASAETFYHLASSHDYTGAWALADPVMQAQLGGFAAFREQQQQDQGVRFDSVRVISASAQAATIAIATTATLTTGTKHCSGTVDLARTPGGWRLHQIHISCS